MAKIKITQTGSPIRRDKTQRATLVGLGLNKMAAPWKWKARPTCSARSARCSIW